MLTEWIFRTQVYQFSRWEDRVSVSMSSTALVLEPSSSWSVFEQSEVAGVSRFHLQKACGFLPKYLLVRNEIGRLSGKKEIHPTLIGYLLGSEHWPGNLVNGNDAYPTPRPENFRNLSRWRTPTTRSLIVWGARVAINVRFLRFYDKSWMKSIDATMTRQCLVRCATWIPYHATTVVTV